MRRYVLKAFFFLIIVSSMVLSVSALGVVPSSHEVMHDPGELYTYKLKIVNNDLAAKTVTFSIDGDLARFMSVEEETLSFRAGEQEKVVIVSFRQPSSTNVQGTISGRVVATEAPVAGGHIVASLSVASRLDLIVPYEGVYAESKLFVGDFSRGKQGNFIVEVDNIGMEDIAEAQVFLKVMNAGTHEIIASLVSSGARVAKGDKQFFTVPWTPDVPNGGYRAVATVTYDGKTADVERAFSIGQRSVAIDAITVNEFSLGGIAKLNILLRSEWSDALSGVSALVEVYQKGQKYASSRTQTVDLPALGSQLVNAYWDTGAVVPGNYDLKVMVFFGDDAVQRSFPITVKQDRIETGFSGQVVGGSSPGGEAFNPIYLLALLIIIVLVVNVVLFRKLLKRK